MEVKMEINGDQIGEWINEEVAEATPGRVVPA